MTGLAQTLRNFWARAIAPNDPKAAGKAATPPVVVYDPGQERPHDLDDPFFDGKVQTRIGDVIAHASHKK